MNVWEKLLKIRQQRGAGYFILIDPDKQSLEDSVNVAKQAEREDADGIFSGGSLLTTTLFDELIKEIKAKLNIPLIIFPGSVQQVSRYADAILYMSVISGRNPDMLIGRQVIVAPVVKKIKLETIATGYMLIESGRVTSAEFMSNTRAIPREKTDIAVAHGLAAEFLGMKILYLDAGSGAVYPVPDEMINRISKICNLPLIVGGGITTPEIARQKVKAGASFIVTGNVFEKDNHDGKIAEFAHAIHV